MRLRHKPNAIPEMQENKYIYFNPTSNKGRWKEIFGNNNPIHLEIGAGMGDFIIKKALANKDINYLALEMNTNAFVVASRKIIDEGIENVRGIIGNAENLEDMFDKGEIDKIYLNFSTPWPKKRHHKRRLSHKRFLDRYLNIVSEGAEIELKTDNTDFFDSSLEYFDEFGIDIIEVDRNLDLEKSIVSEYENKFRMKDMPIYFVRAKFNNWGEKMRKVKKILIALFVIVILSFASYFFGMKAGGLNNKDKISSDIVKEQLLSVKELTTLKYRYTNVGSFENQSEFYGMKIPFTTKKFIISYDGVVSAGVDLDETKVDIDDKNNIINIRLAKAKIISHEIDEDSLTIFDEKNSIFNQLKLEDFSDFRKNEMKKVEENLTKKGFLEEANKKSKDAIVEILNINPVIKADYTIKLNW